jgi:Tol biopolymer transport system component
MRAAGPVLRRREQQSPEDSILRRTPTIDSSPTRIVPLTRLAGKESWPAFAPDGDQVAFAWSGEKFENTDIYVTLVGSTNVRRVTDPADDFAPRS